MYLIFTIQKYIYINKYNEVFFSKYSDKRKYGPVQIPILVVLAA